MSPHGPALHLHRQINTALLQKAGTPYSSQDLRNIMDSVDGGNADFRTKLCRWKEPGTFPQNTTAKYLSRPPERDRGL